MDYRDYRKDMKSAMKDFKSQSQEFMNSYSSMMETMSDSEYETMREGVRSQESSFRDRLKSLKQFIKSSTKMTTKTFKEFTNRFKTTVSVLPSKILKSFNKNVDKSMDDFRKSSKDAIDDVESEYSSLSDALGKLSLSSDLGDIKGTLEDSVKSNMEIRQELQRIAGLDDKSYSELSGLAKEFSKSTGYKISSNEYLSSIADIMKDTGIKDSKLASQIADSLVTGAKALDTSTSA